MAKVILLTGSNLGDRFTYLNDSLLEISKTVGVLVMQSSLYESKPWGFESDNPFLNQVLVIETNLLPHVVLKEINIIEKELGRVRLEEGYSDRVVDIDILFYDDKIIDTIDLIIPHARLHERRFTLEPLMEIMPDFIHPKLNKTIIELVDLCSDKEVPVKL